MTAVTMEYSKRALVIGRCVAFQGAPCGWRGSCWSRCCWLFGQQHVSWLSGKCHLRSWLFGKCHRWFSSTARPAAVISNEVRLPIRDGGAHPETSSALAGCFIQPPFASKTKLFGGGTRWSFTAARLTTLATPTTGCDLTIFDTITLYL